MLKSLIPPLELVTDDDETILFNEVCGTPYSFQFQLLLSGIAIGVLFPGMIICQTSINILMHDQHILAKLNITAVDVFFQVFKYYISEMWMLFIIVGPVFFLMTELLLGIFPVNVIVTNKRVILNTYQLMIFRNFELALSNIKELRKKNWTNADGLVIELHHKTARSRFFVINSFNRTETIRNLLLTQLDNPKTENTVIKNPFFKSKKITQAFILQWILLFLIPTVGLFIGYWLSMQTKHSQLIISWTCFYCEQM
jgi:hypothetical protein